MSSASRRIAHLTKHLTPHTRSAASAAAPPPPKPRCKAVIFDLGGVLLGSPMPAIRAFERDAGVREGAIFAAAAGRGHAGAFQRLERGELVLEDFVPEFERELREGGLTLGLSVEELFKRMEECLVVREDVAMAVKSIRAEGLKTAALTNNWVRRSGESLLGFAGGRELSSLFDVVHESCRTGRRKPDPAAYEGVLEALKLSKTPECAIFLDDLGSNLKAARELGIRTIKVGEEAAPALGELREALGFPLDEYVPGTKSVRASMRFDHAALELYLGGCGAPGLSGKVTRVREFGHGQSNPTYHVTIAGGKEVVLRKKPPGKILRGAHAVEREFQVLKALGNAGYPVAPAHVLCEDDAVIGTPFYVMDYVPGSIHVNPHMPGCDGATRAAAYDAMNEVLAGLHTLKPADIGLGEYGKHQGYYSRQVATWGKQYMAAKTGDIPEMDSLGSWLAANLPPDANPAVVHGDFRLDNIIFDTAGKGKVKAVLDWELSTIGDPIADLAYNCLVYYLHPKFQIPGFLGIPLPEGVPSEEAYVAAYCRRVGRVGGIANWNFYLAFAFFRIAAILQGVYKRALMGNASSSQAEAIGAQAANMAKMGWKLAQSPRNIGA